MPIIVICQDSKEAPILRKTHLKEHLNYLDKVAPFICVAGPMMQSDAARASGDYDGSCFIYDTSDMSVASKLLKNDPYAINGVFENAAFTEFLPNVGRWVTDRS